MVAHQFTLGRISVISVSLAAFGMIATPLAAAELPHSGAPVVYDSHAGDAHGWGYRGYRRHSGAHIRTGDAIAGIAILGAVAAIASAANNTERTRTREVYREPPVRYSDNSRGDRGGNGWSRGGINGAVDTCVNQVERGDERIDSVDEATRDGSGWRVSGTLNRGGGFSCRIDNEGRIRAVDLGDQYSQADDRGVALANADGQLSDAAYHSARASTRTPIDEAPVAANPAAEPRPAYPGGPLPGDEVDADLLGG